MRSSAVYTADTVRGGLVPRLARVESTLIAPDAQKAAVKTLLNELLDAQQTGKTQTVQDTRDKLNALRERLGDEKFKGILEQLKKDADQAWLALLKALFPELFPDEDPPSPPFSPAPPGGGGGGRRGSSVNPADFGPSESMSNRPLTEGAKYYDYKVDNSNPGKKPDNIWSGFSQGDVGNCVTVSAIKAAMMHFGQKPTDVFKSVKEAGDGWDVVMRDNFSVHVSKNELKMAAQYARFKGDDPSMLTDANFMYAASVKRVQKEGNDGLRGQSFNNAMLSLNDGEYSREGLVRLGLKNNIRAATDAELRRSKVGTVEYGGHSMAVLDGRLELWGRRGEAPGSGTATVLFGS
ncbi:hypothetical protein ACSSUR_16515 [Pseudomonas cedrina]|uniref:hypothetical protein n=1 Tax=Pseudomonas cedrina TaxID=651740 RepID=UPI003ED9E794